MVVSRRLVRLRGLRYLVADREFRRHRCCRRRFQYTELFQKAAFDACARQLFGSFKTTDFAVVLERLILLKLVGQAGSSPRRVFRRRHAAEKTG